MANQPANSVVPGPSTNQTATRAGAPYEGNDFRDSFYRRKFSRRTWREVPPEHKAKTGFGQWMQSYVSPYLSNNIQGLVYAGAALLVMIVGLRGLGNLQKAGVPVPDFLLTDGRLSAGWIMIGLTIECIMLVIMAALYIWTPEEYVERHPAKNAGRGGVSEDDKKLMADCIDHAKEIAKEHPPLSGSWSPDHIERIAAALFHSRRRTS